ncbi:phosphoribosylformylglycinamidine synthase subunit PurS [Natronoglycomyces albus]|uniref:Phosphoribosylformylglycinamidine synthase subunit PurS n=1 Tax=Natronoglycomyces albus TaxID=2811108 RepID=A0A895XHL2_9ACTN|nr:phosphoribosylformylglycinamidine synthase subunit PurS [Natronoglycomyces albus]QSB05321.1 phosphoribosylformylglycinamidine synthase subunit PurS [Natronoglycomyces albus]
MARVVVDVMLKPDILDPQGEAVKGALPNLGVEGVERVRIGKRIELDFAEGVDAASVEEQARKVADALLANPVIEDFTIASVEADAPAGAS